MYFIDERSTDTHVIDLQTPDLSAVHEAGAEFLAELSKLVEIAVTLSARVAGGPKS